MKNSATHVLPDDNDTLLLKAALWQGRSALDAYERWKTSVDIDTLPHGSTRLLPLLHHNLTRLDVKDALTSKLKGLSKYTWLSNNRLLYNALPCFQKLDSEKIPFVVLKGAALTLAYYQDLSLRPMEDIDILVPKRFIPRAVAILEKSGFRTKETRPNINDYFEYRHSLNFVGPSKCDIDLHCYILEDCCGDGDAHPFYTPFEVHHFKGTPMSVPDPTHLFFHVLTHGLRWNPTSPIRWVADASAILSSSDVDWIKLQQYAINYELVTPLQIALRALKNIFNQPIPYEALKLIMESPVTKRDYRTFSFHASPYNSLLPSYRNHRDHFKKVGGRSFINFCKQYWGLESVAQLPPSLSRKVWKKCRHLMKHEIS